MLSAFLEFIRAKAKWMISKPKVIASYALCSGRHSQATGTRHMQFIAFVEVERFSLADANLHSQPFARSFLIR